MNFTKTKFELSSGGEVGKKGWNEKGMKAYIVKSWVSGHKVYLH